MNILQILYYDRIDVSEGADCNKTSASKVCDICSFKFQPNFCNRCHDLLMISINFSDFAILNIKSSDYRCIISLINKMRL